MWKAAAFIAGALMGAAVGHAQPADGGTEDDLAVVKRAVEREGDAAAPPATVRRTDQARWFRVRIEERNGARIKVNLPLGLVRDLDDRVPLDWGCGRKHRGCRLRAPALRCAGPARRGRGPGRDQGRGLDRAHLGGLTDPPRGHDLSPAGNDTCREVASNPCNRCPSRPGTFLASA
jgi:hypothetical protein